MTLILNEIHVINGLNDTFMMAAADRQVTDVNGNFLGKRQKLFAVPSINGAVSYFGAAQVMSSRHLPYLSDWLPKFIAQHADIHDVGAFAEALQTELNRLVAATELERVPSGFHICGYQEQGYPDFWTFSNIGDVVDFSYRHLSPGYGKPASHFLNRDAKEHGWNGLDPTSIKQVVRVYRNGDYRAHVAAWLKLDEILSWLAQYPDFSLPTTHAEYEDYVDFKFGFIDYLYARRAKKQVIARPIDILVLMPP